MNPQKVAKWRRHAGVILNEINDFRERVRDERIFWFALDRHRELDPEESQYVYHLYKIHKVVIAMAVRRLVRPQKDAVTLFGLLEDLATHPADAAAAYPALPLADVIRADAAELRERAPPLIDFADQELAHRDLRPEFDTVAAIGGADNIATFVLASRRTRL